jgi:L-alanine-DL-glutamate epimerase-like enolase superfamily enzyme
VKIADVSVTVMEHGHAGRVPKIVPAGSPRRLRYTHEWEQSGKTGFESYELFLRVRTDDGVEGVCTCSSPELTPRQVEILRATVIGLDPLHREEIYQRLHLGTRWVYQPPGWFGNFDNCLWDIAGKVAGLPVCQLIGQVRDRIPAYHTGDDGPGTAEHYLAMLAEVRETFGITAYKFHNYQGPRQNVPLFRTMRRELGDDYTLINDPVCSYSLREAIEVGRVMEELGFLWLEEPFREQELRQYQELCRELTIPVMATEMLMHDVNICAQWLMAGATDLVRANARGGTTALLKMAHFAELYGTNVEINGPGGLGGHVHVQLQCAIANTELFEHFRRFAPLARECGITNPPSPVDGHLTPSMLPGWGAEIDWDYVEERTVETY